MYLGCSFLSHAMMPFSKALAKAELSRSDNRKLASTLPLCLPVRPTGTWLAVEVLSSASLSSASLSALTSSRSYGIEPAWAPRILAKMSLTELSP